MLKIKLNTTSLFGHFAFSNSQSTSELIVVSCYRSRHFENDRLFSKHFSNSKIIHLPSHKSFIFKEQGEILKKFIEWTV